MSSGGRSVLTRPTRGPAGGARTEVPRAGSAATGASAAAGGLMVSVMLAPFPRGSKGGRGAASSAARRSGSDGAARAAKTGRSPASQHSKYFRPDMPPTRRARGVARQVKGPGSRLAGRGRVTASGTKPPAAAEPAGYEEEKRLWLERLGAWNAEREKKVLAPPLSSRTDLSPPTPRQLEEEAKKAWLARLDARLDAFPWTPGGTAPAGKPATKRGTVKFYRQDQGWGFIEPENEGEIEVFVHYSSIKKDGWRSLMPGEQVEYTIVVRPDGRVACGTVTGPDGASVQGFDPLMAAGYTSVKEVTDSLAPESDEDDVFDDTIYIYDNDFYSN